MLLSALIRNHLFSLVLSWLFHNKAGILYLFSILSLSFVSTTCTMVRVMYVVYILNSHVASTYKTSKNSHLNWSNVIIYIIGLLFILLFYCSWCMALSLLLLLLQKLFICFLFSVLIDFILLFDESMAYWVSIYWRASIKLLSMFPCSTYDRGYSCYPQIIY